MISLRRILTKNHISLCRNYCANQKLVEITHDNETGISVLSMARPPVNSLNTELLKQLGQSLNELQDNGSKGIILTSSLPSVFSAGLDLMEMYEPDLKKATNFWHTLQDTWLTLYGLNIPVAAAINGACPAGGCLLSISCEYRVFVDGKHTIGLNETKLGITAPKWFKDVYVSTLGYRTAEIALLRGSLFSPNEALKIGLVDELATDKADAIKKCQNYISGFRKISSQARAQSKFELRKEQLLWLKENKEMDTKRFLTFILMPEVQAGLKLYIESLKQKTQ